MFGFRKSRKVTATTAETFSRIYIAQAGDAYKPHEVSIERNGMRFGAPSIHRTREEAASVARAVARQFPDAYISVNVVL